MSESNDDYLFETNLDELDLDSTTIITIDLGYSAKKKSCGLVTNAAEDEEDVNRKFRFGKCLEKTVEIIENSRNDVLLILEAPLSTFHNDGGNPVTRGQFEEQIETQGWRGWYAGSGAVTFAAAHRFLKQLEEKLDVDSRTVYLAEAFLSNKDGPTDDFEDANDIFSEIDEKESVETKDDLEPIADSIRGVPAIFSF